MKPLIGQDLPN